MTVAPQILFLVRRTIIRGYTVNAVNARAMRLGHRLAGDLSVQNIHSLG